MSRDSAMQLTICAQGPNSLTSRGSPHRSHILQRKQEGGGLKQ